MKRLLVTTVVTVLTQLTLAGPANADDQSYLDYLNSHGYAPIALYELRPDIQLKDGHRLCGQLRAGVPVEDLRASMDPPYWMVIEAAQHEMCPETLR